MQEIAIYIYETADEVLLSLADSFVDMAQKAIDEKSEFTVALSGGSSPKKLYELLASSEFSSQVDWNKVYFFFGDERYVPADDLESNALMAKKALFEPLRIPAENIFTVDTTLPPAEAAAKYAEVIQTRFQSDKARFDLILLGLGDDAHTASLFPNTSVLAEEAATVKEVFLPEKNVYRITLTAPLINQAHQVAFLVYGESKAEAVHIVLEEENNFEKYPAQLIDPIDGEMQWFLDEAAAARLETEAEDDE
ncbi:6-phosphogluconolactonase [Tellurirhabdus bombi]|uniref:6-phosphogluconolactonase n=1 Tax=Tellurirhabdus bombi TaxID=2907205 RepID=UPI001F325EA3|nr:6-phosphogluconolactonase [Tellurirhabdus bombi]